MTTLKRCGNLYGRLRRLYGMITVQDETSKHSVCQWIYDMVHAGGLGHVQACVSSNEPLPKCVHSTIRESIL